MATLMAVRLLIDRITIVRTGQVVDVQASNDKLRRVLRRPKESRAE